VGVENKQGAELATTQPLPTEELSAREMNLRARLATRTLVHPDYLLGRKILSGATMGYPMATLALE